MLTIDNPVQEVTGIRSNGLPEEIFASTEPLLLKGLVAEWPVVQAARESTRAALDYVRHFYQNATVGAFFGAPEIKGRIFYNEDLTGFNFHAAKVKLDEILDQLEQYLGDDSPPSFYVGSTTLDTCLPGFRAENDVYFGDIDPLASVWLGNHTRIAAHFDVPDNLACCAVGRRRVTLFPPGELKNLYVGPLDFTPAGQAISIVDFHDPDFGKYPRFREALKNARVAEMEPGDAIFIPGMWWHHVEALDGFNVLINYWWRQTPAFMDSPANVLDHALLSLRDLPEEQRKAWHELFQYYIFDLTEDAFAHIPADRRGVLSPLDELAARKLRAQILNKLNR